MFRTALGANPWQGMHDSGRHSAPCSIRQRQTFAREQLSITVLAHRIDIAGIVGGLDPAPGVIREYGVRRVAQKNPLAFLPAVSNNRRRWEEVGESGEEWWTSSSDAAAPDG